MILSPMQNNYVTKEEFGEFKDDMLEFKDNTEIRFDKIDERFNSVDERFNIVNRRFDSVENEIKKLKQFTDEGFDGMEQLMINSFIEFGDKIENKIGNRIKESEDRVISHINSKFNVK